MPQMYIKLRNDIPVAYRYGDEWVAAQLWIDGGYPTEEEAIAAWEKENKQRRSHHDSLCDQTEEGEHD